jgi:DNA-binding NtrC family response regulator
MLELNHNSRILLLDDEEIVTTSLRNLFRLRTSYSLVIHNSPKEALADAPNHKFDLVISDYLMPGMDGIAFLSRFKEIHPQAVRILLTGYADKESAIRAINQVGLYQYIEKPWDNDSLLIAIKNGLEKRALLSLLDQKIAELSEVHSNLKNFQKELIKAFI